MLIDELLPLYVDFPEETWQNKIIMLLAIMTIAFLFLLAIIVMLMADRDERKGLRSASRAGKVTERRTESL